MKIFYPNWKFQLLGIRMEGKIPNRVQKYYINKGKKGAFNI